MSSVRVVGQPPDPAAVFAIFDEEARAAGAPAVDLVKGSLESVTPRDSSATADAITSSYRRNADGFTGTVRFGGGRAYIARFLEKGTKARRIEPRAKRRGRGRRPALSVPGVGFRRSVQHPGTAATHFIEETEQRVQPALEQIYDRAAARAVDRVSRL